MKLFIANCSSQAHLFNYKLPERTQTFSRPIGAGDQIVIDCSPEDCSSIISQHEPYGFSDIAKIPANFSGLCYSQDKEIKLTKMKSGYEARQEFLDVRAQEIRDNSALSMNNELTKAAKSHGKEEIPGFEMTIESQPLEPGQEDKKPFKQKLKVEK